MKNILLYLIPNVFCMICLSNNTLVYFRSPEARGYKWSEMHSQATPASKINDLGGSLDVSYCSYNQLHIITKN